MAAAKENIWRTFVLTRTALEEALLKINFLQAPSLGFSGAGAFCFPARPGSLAGRTRARVIGLFEGIPIAGAWKNKLSKIARNVPLKTQALKLFVSRSRYDRFASTWRLA